MSKKFERLDSSVMSARVGNEFITYDGGTHMSTEISDPMSPKYDPQPRFDHCSSLINQRVYVYQGLGCSFDSPIVEEYDVCKEEWSRRSVAGGIPEARFGITSADDGSKFFAFGGEIKAKSYSNTLSEFDVSTMTWKTLHPTNPKEAPMPKKDAAMISYKDFLVIFGGLGVSAGTHRGVKYVRGGADEVWTNEVTLYDLERSQWIWKKISGSAPAPCSECTFTYIGQDKAIVLGGTGKGGKIGKGDMKTMKILDLLNWKWLTITCKPWQEMLFPEYCYGHCAVSLHEVLDCSMAPSLLLLWGRTDEAKYQNDMWQLTINADGGIWRKVSSLEGTNTSCPPAYKCTADIVRTPDDLQLIRFGGFIMDKKFPFDETWIVDLACTYDNKVAVMHCRIPRPISNASDVNTISSCEGTADDIVIARKCSDRNITPTENHESPSCAVTNSSCASSSIADIPGVAYNNEDGASATNDLVSASCSDVKEFNSNEACSENFDSDHNGIVRLSSSKEKVNLSSSPDCTTNLNLEDRSNQKILTFEEKNLESYCSAFTKHQEYPGLNFFNHSVVEELKYSKEEQHINMENMGLSFVIPPEAITPDRQLVNLTVAPAVSGNIEVPSDCHSHSPLYMITPCKLAKKAKINVDHTCAIESEDDVGNMVVLVPVDLSESQRSGTYVLQEADVERSFQIGSQTGEIAMMNLQPFRVAKKESCEAKNKKKARKLYTARLYTRSPKPSTPNDILVFCVSQLHPSFIKCLKDQMSRNHPELVHMEAFNALQFREDCSEISLSIPDSDDINGWAIDTLKKVITRDEVDLPDELDITGIDYPPMIILTVRNDRPHPSQNGTRCSLKVIGFTQKSFEISIVFEIIGVQRREMKSFSHSISQDDVSLMPILYPHLYCEETVLQTRDLKVLYRYLKEVSVYWKDIGLELGFPMHALDIIETNPMLLVRGCEAFLQDMLTKWLQKSEKGARSVGKLKEALLHVSCNHVAESLLDKLNSDYRSKVSDNIQHAVTEFRSFMNTWVENDMIRIGYSVADLLETVQMKIKDFSDLSDTAEDLHRRCLLLHNHEAVQVILKNSTRASEIDLQGAVDRCVDDSNTLLKIMSNASSTTESLPSLLQNIQRIIKSMQRLYERTEAASICDINSPIKWKRRLMSRASFPIFSQGLH